MKNKETIVEDFTELILHCTTCHLAYKFKAWEDPTTSSGCCKTCGSSYWYITDLSGNRIE